MKLFAYIFNLAFFFCSYEFHCRVSTKLDFRFGNDRIMLKWFPRMTTFFRKKNMFVNNLKDLHFTFHDACYFINLFTSWMFTHYSSMCEDHFPSLYQSWLHTLLFFWVAYIISFFSVLFVSWIKWSSSSNNIYIPIASFIIR